MDERRKPAVVQAAIVGSLVVAAVLFAMYLTAPTDDIWEFTPPTPPSSLELWLERWSYWGVPLAFAITAVVALLFLRRRS